MTLGLFDKSDRPEGAPVMQEPAILHRNVTGLRAQGSAVEASGNGVHARGSGDLVPTLMREALRTRKLFGSSP